MKTIVLNSKCKPQIMRHGDSGYDLSANGEFYIPPHSSLVIPLGVCFDIPYGYYGLLTHRSSLAFKYGSILSLGNIDSNFKKEIKALVFNLGDDEVYIKEGQRIAQIIFNRYYESTLEIVEEFHTEGKDGFGSSG